MPASVQGTAPASRPGTLPPLRADILFLHAPAVFDFRDRRDIYFPFLGTSGDVPITPLYEYFPIGFKTLQRFLGDRGSDVKLLNLSSLLLRYPHLPMDSVIEALDAPVVGIDLHWMVHVQGSLEVARRIKALRPDIAILFGGTSSTYYADELIRMPQIDMVMRGYDTHEPMAALMEAVRHGRSDYRGIPNLLWKSRDGDVHDNDFSHLPATFSCGVDWTTGPDTSVGSGIREVLSTQNAGCAYNCGWCGGSREAFRRIFKKKPSMARKVPEEVAYEFETMGRVEGADNYHFYSVGSYNETRQGMEFFLDRVAESRFKSISYEQFRLTSDHTLKRMAEANAHTSITLSPESHDPRVAKLAGRGVFSNEEMEEWIYRALDIGIHQIDVWYFIGMPEQDERSVMETVDYCHHLLTKFQGLRVNPMLCPMIPFLDPASTFFENPDQHGYRIFYRTAEEHRRGMERASLINRINYETRWLSRRDLVHVGFKAVRRLMEAKAELRFLPGAWVRNYNASIDDALEFIDVVHEADCITDAKARAAALDELGDDILRRNNQVLFSGVRNQAFPINRDIGGRWFDETGWPVDVLDSFTSLESVRSS
ncbi:cobalamin-dependent protein [Streptomyces sp. NPDC006235]|uniref:B12-binding domain-containing radical SAM protein n=1 Tax=Streptomyces sp. NPDC006235 TaxID=3156736 RepID=UPI0033BFB10D